MKNSFLLYLQQYEPIKNLSNEKKGLLLTAIFEWQLNRTEIKLPDDCKMAFMFFKNQFEIDENKYTKIIERNKNNGLLGGRPITQKNPKNPVGFRKPKKPDNDNDNDNDNDKRKPLTFENIYPLLTEKHIGQFLERYSITRQELLKVWEQMLYSRIASGKPYKNWISALHNWVVPSIDQGRIGHQPSEITFRRL